MESVAKIQKKQQKQQSYIIDIYMSWSGIHTRKSFLLIIFDKKNNSWIFEKIYLGDIWKPNMHSPLAEPGVLVEEGDQLLSIGGIQLDQSNTPGELLVNHAKEQI